MLLVLVLDSNTILGRNQPLEAHIQRENIRAAAAAIAKIAEEHQTVIVHDLGAQVALLSLMNESYEEVNNYPLDALGAMSKGMAGFGFEKELYNALPKQNICSVSIQTLIDPDDPAMATPNTWTGPVYTHDEAQFIKDAWPDWVLNKDGHYFRRVVPSPMPREIFGLSALRHIVSSGNITLVCGSGGGVPVRRDVEGELHGVAAIIDPDRTAQLLAEGLEADGLLYLTDQEALEIRNDDVVTRKIKECTPEHISTLSITDNTNEGKVECVCHFVRSGGKFGAIGRLHCAETILAGSSGTFVKVNIPKGIRYYD